MRNFRIVRGTAFPLIVSCLVGVFPLVFPVTSLIVGPSSPAGEWILPFWLLLSLTVWPLAFLAAVRPPTIRAWVAMVFVIATSACALIHDALWLGRIEGSGNKELEWLWLLAAVVSWAATWVTAHLSRERERPLLYDWHPWH